MILLLFLHCGRFSNQENHFLPHHGILDGWLAIGNARNYSVKTLYEFIDGEAEHFIAYGFNALHTRTYGWEGDEESSFVVEVYDMGDRLNAFGVYSSYRYPGVQREKIGSEAIVSEYGILFFRGRFFVKIRSGEESENVRVAMGNMARWISSQIDDSTSFPEEIRLLPEKHQVEGTLQYIADSMLNQSFLPGGIQADYQIGDELVTGFVVIFDDTTEARDGLQRLFTYYSDSDGYIDFKGDTLRVRTDYHGWLWTVRHHTMLVGVQDLPALELGKTLIESVLATVEETIR